MSLQFHMCLDSRFCSAVMVSECVSRCYMRNIIIYFFYSSHDHNPSCTKLPFLISTVNLVPPILEPYHLSHAFTMAYFQGGIFAAVVRRLHIICVTHVHTLCAKDVQKMLIIYVSKGIKDFVVHA